MKRKIPFSLFCMFCISFGANAETTQWVENTDGDLKANEYRAVDTKGAVTRRPCPYTCAMREIPKESCKEWKSITHSVDGECYVQDLRISKDDAMPNDTRGESQRSAEGYSK